MKQVIEGKVYNTGTATSLCSNHFDDGSNRLPHGEGWELYVTKKGNFFVHHETQWIGERDYLEPVSKEEVAERYGKRLSVPQYEKYIGKPIEA